MKDKERLNELFKEIEKLPNAERCVACKSPETGNRDCKSCLQERNVNFLIENGVVAFPCKVGDKVSVRALCECVITTPDYEECRNICPFEDDCECEECYDSNDRIFDTKVSAIYDNGNGWCIELEHFIMEARFTDIGTSIFIGENAHEQAVAYNKALAERNKNEQEKV